MPPLRSVANGPVRHPQASPPRFVVNRAPQCAPLPSRSTPSPPARAARPPPRSISASPWPRCNRGLGSPTPMACRPLDPSHRCHHSARRTHRGWRTRDRSGPAGTPRCSAISATSSSAITAGLGSVPASVVAAPDRSAISSRSSSPSARARAHCRPVVVAITLPRHRVRRSPSFRPRTPALRSSTPSSRRFWASPPTPPPPCPRPRGSTN